MGFAPGPVDPRASSWHLLGAAIRHWRDDVRRLSLQSVAEKVWVDPSNLSKWERGERPAPLDAVERLDAVLGTNGFLIALRGAVDAVDSTSVTDESDVGRGEQMDGVRRQLLGALAAMGGAAALPMDGLERLRQLVDGGIGSPRLEDWEEITWEHAHSVTARPLPEAITDLALDVLTVQRLMETVPARGGAAWGIVNAKMTFLLAHLLGVAGQTRQSRHWWITARRAAEQSGDPKCVAAAYAYEAMQGLYERRPLALVLERADHAIAAAGDIACQGVAEAYAVRAQASTLTGDDVGARKGSGGAGPHIRASA
jgi:transcriptional regulator with XRE-family HTH domain